jgi:hypothetical protein
VNHFLSFKWGQEIAVPLISLYFVRQNRKVRPNPVDAERSLAAMFARRFPSPNAALPQEPALQGRQDQSLE